VSAATGSTEGDPRNAPARSAEASMRALMLVGDRKLELRDVTAPPAPAPGEVQIGIKAIGLNHIDVWGWRGMAFAKRKLPIS
jgi:alcohol dehydrogenase